MDSDIIEDLKDIQEISRLKEEQKQSNEELSTWGFGKGINNKEGNKNDIRSEIQ